MLRAAALKVLLSLAVLPGSIFAQTIEVPQADGSLLSLDPPAARIVSLSPNLTELVYAAGAGDLLLATVEYSDYPAAANDLPRVGDAFRIDTEQIHHLSPDLVLAWPSGNPAAALAQLEDLGIKVWRIEIKAPGEIADTVEHIGRVTQRESAHQVVQPLRDRIDTLASRYQSAEVISFFYQIAAQPLLYRWWRTSN